MVLSRACTSDDVLPTGKYPAMDDENRFGKRREKADEN